MTYYYRVTDAAGNTASGTFRTPAALGTHNGLRFGVTGDTRGELSPYPSVRNAADQNLDFMVLLGDTIYADFPSPDLPAPQALTLDDYRTKHNEVYSERYGLNTLADLRMSTALYSTIDDHEVMNDFAGGAPRESDARFSAYQGTLINDTELFANGIQAFLDYNPMRDETYQNTGDARLDGRRKFYRYVTFGSDAAIFLLDARSFRDTPIPVLLDFSNRVELLNYLSQMSAPDRTLLGQAQLDELEADLTEAQAAGVTWKFILVPEPIQNFGVLNASDRFEGYAFERTQLLSFIHDQEISNVVFITADFHGTVVNNLEYRDTPLTASIPISSFEIITGPVAFDAPMGPTVVRLASAFGLLSAEQVTAYNAMTLTEKDAYMAELINAQVEPLGYNPVGLQDADLLDAELIQGSYVAVHYYGWTEFEIDAETQRLHVTTYGIAPYTQAELDADPDAITARTPEVVSEFVVTPQTGE
jgi:3-phytase/alkaline phosphatase D